MPNNDVLTAYLTAKEQLLEHVGLKPDWVEYPIDDLSSAVWCVDEGDIRWADSEPELISGEGNCYSAEIYTQRFYKSHVFRGDKYTLVFADPHVDGCRWWYIFSNDHEIKEGK